MPVIDVRSNIEGVIRRLDDKARNQVPYAASQALNTTAFEIRKHLIEVTFPRDFNLKNKRWPAVAMRVEKASKRRLTAVVFDRLGRASLVLHAKGGTKVPRGKNLAVPVNVVRGASGAITPSRRPRALVGNKNVFIANIRRRGVAIWQRTGGRRRRGLKLLYTLTPAAPISRRLSFYEDAAVIARRAFDRNFLDALAKAIATAR